MMDPIISRWQAANSTLLDHLPIITQQIHQSRLDDKARLEAAIYQQPSVEIENQRLRQIAVERDGKIRQMVVEGKERTDQLMKAVGENNELEIKLAQVMKENTDYGEKVTKLEQGGRMREMQMHTERRDLDQEHERKMAQREAAHHRTVEQMKTQHEETLSTLIDKHLAAISTVQDQHVETIRRVSELEGELTKAQAKANEYKDTARQWRVLSEELKARMVDIAEGNVSIRLVEGPTRG